MKELLKNQAGAVVIVVILVLVLATAGGGAAFLAVRMVVSGDGNFLQPFEELGWIDPKDDDSSKEEKEDKDDKEDKSDKKDKNKEKSGKVDQKTSSSSQSGKTTDYLVEDSRLSSEAKKSDVEHYYGSIDLTESMGAADDEYADLYKLMKAGVNLYSKDDKVIEIVFGFDISDFCKEAYKQYPEEFSAAGMDSADDLQDMMMSMIETMYDAFDEEYSEYISKYVDGGSFQMYVTEKGFESLYETYNISEGENDLDTLKDALEDSFNCKIELVK